MTRDQNWNTHAVIFDMDGVLVDTEPLYVKVNQQVLKRFGIDMPGEEQLKFVGIASRDMWRTLRKKFGLSESVETLFQLEMDAVYHTLKSSPVLEPMTGVIALLDALRKPLPRLVRLFLGIDVFGE